MRSLLRRACLVAGAMLALAGPSHAQTPLLDAIAGADVDAGRATAQMCLGCHSFGPGQPHFVGPNLYGIVLAPIARHDGYRYTPALADLGATGALWTYERLDAFLTSPSALVPGTAMPIGIADDQTRVNLIAFLRTLAETPAPLVVVQGEAGAPATVWDLAEEIAGLIDALGESGGDPDLARDLADLTVLTTQALIDDDAGALRAIAEQLRNRGEAGRFGEQLAAAADAIAAIAVDPAVAAEARARADEGRSAALQGNYSAAEAILGALRQRLAVLQSSFTVTIVSRPGEASGIFRIPDANPEARNYYLIVEALDASGAPVLQVIRSEEDNTRRLVAVWGIRVTQETYDAVAADKVDDGMIQNALVGEKAVGELEIRWVIPTLGGAITAW